MRQEDILRLPSMPMAGPSYPAGPYRFINREFLVITYETDPDLIRMGLAEPLEPIEQPIVHYEWIKMPDSSGLRQLHRDRPRDPGALPRARTSTSSRRCIWTMIRRSLPGARSGASRRNTPIRSSKSVKDTLTGTLEYAGQQVAMGTMAYKHGAMAGNGEATLATLSQDPDQSEADPGRRWPRRRSVSWWRST